MGNVPGKPVGPVLEGPLLHGSSVDTRMRACVLFSSVPSRLWKV